MSQKKVTLQPTESSTYPAPAKREFGSQTRELLENASVEINQLRPVLEETADHMRVTNEHQIDAVHVQRDTNNRLAKATRVLFTIALLTGANAGLSILHTVRAAGTISRLEDTEDRLMSLKDELGKAMALTIELREGMQEQDTELRVIRAEAESTPKIVANAAGELQLEIPEASDTVPGSSASDVKWAKPKAKKSRVMRHISLKGL